ncbi:hypothetical protein [Streptomyces sp. NPDC001508]
MTGPPEAVRPKYPDAPLGRLSPHQARGAITEVGLHDTLPQVAAPLAR